MSLSLRDQLIAAGLVSKKHAKEANKPVRPPQISRNKPPPLPPAALAAQRTQAEKFAKFRTLAEKSGDLTRGKTLFTTTCMGCHSVGGAGGQVGPVPVQDSGRSHAAAEGRHVVAAVW